MDQLVLSGHSYGGLTSLIASAKAKKAPKAVVVMDPWMYANCEDFQNGKIQVPCPVQMIHSEKFHPSINKKDFDSWGTVLSTLKHAKD